MMNENIYSMKKIILSLLMSGLMFCSAEAREVTGTVTCGEAKLKGVIVTDGEHFTQTGKNGKFKFEINDDADFVYLVTPSGYVADWSTGVPAFYQKAAGVSKFDFNLQRTAGGNDYNIIAIADPQMNTERHFEQFSGAPMADLCRTAQSLTLPAVGLALGDIAWESFPILKRWGGEIVKTGIPFYPVPGNHDHDYYADGDEAAIQQYRDIIGPENYAFFLGKDLVIVLDNIIYKTACTYDCGYAPEQLEWVRVLVSKLPSDADIYVAQHSPVTDWDGGKIRNGNALIDILRGREVLFMSGHTHENNNYVYEKNIKEHNIAAICGAWWDTQLCTDGTPGGYKVYTKHADKLSWYYKSWAHGKEYQIQAYGLGEVKTYPNGIAVSVWDQDPDWTVEWYEDGIPMGEMDQAPIASPAYGKQIEAIYGVGKVSDWKKPTKCINNFTALPSRGAKNVVIVAHSPFGKKYTATLELSDVDVRVPVSVVDDMKKAMDEGANTICMDVLRREDGTAVLTSGVLLSELLDATEAYTAEKGYSPIRYHFTIHRGPESYDKTADAVMQELIYRYISERVTVDTSDRLMKNFIKEKYPEFK